MKLTTRKTSAAIAGLLLASSLSVTTAYAAVNFNNNNGCLQGESGCTVYGLDDFVALTSHNPPIRTQQTRSANFMAELGRAARGMNSDFLTRPYRPMHGDRLTPSQQSQYGHVF
ncbi:MAG: hypothetical protein CMF39_03430 [Legionellaceae bacterium]|nr:hypothetical protein [Legionellaceae bacterium]